jgi:hypothetical protein
VLFDPIFFKKKPNVFEFINCGLLSLKIICMIYVENKEEVWSVNCKWKHFPY